MAMREEFEFVTKPPPYTKLTTLMDRQADAVVELGVDHPLVVLYGDTIAKATATNPPPAKRVRDARAALEREFEETDDG